MLACFWNRLPVGNSYCTRSSFNIFSLIYVLLDWLILDQQVEKKLWTIICLNSTLFSLYTFYYIFYDTIPNFFSYSSLLLWSLSYSCVLLFLIITICLVAVGKICMKHNHLYYRMKREVVMIYLIYYVFVFGTKPNCGIHIKREPLYL